MRKSGFNLIIDIGNTFAKIAFFKEQELVQVKSLSKITYNDLLSVISDIDGFEKDATIEYAILSAVGDYPKELISLLSNNFRFIKFTHLTKTPVKNLYASPQTLGLDRLAAVVGATQYLNGHDLLVIDCGTCITYDFLTSKNEYLGGSISPGIEMRFKSLNNFTANLPLVNRFGKFELIGDTTENAIRSGILNGVIKELDGIIAEYHINYPELKVLMTGGDVKYFDGKLKNDIFANSNLVLEGLNLILDYNIDE